MNSEWIKSPTARRVLVHWADARPTWLWSADGETLLWRNTSARFFHGRVKKHGVKLAPEAAPIKGQIARLIRLGSMGRSSLSRIQFLAGDRPISTTCTVTPLELEDGTAGLLIVGVDAIEPELLEAPSLNGVTESLLPSGSNYLLIDDDGQIAGGSGHALEAYAPYLESEGVPDLPDEGSGKATISDEALTITRFRASPRDAILLLFEGAEPSHPRIDEVRAEEGLRDVEASEPMLPLGLPPVDDSAPSERQAGDDHWVEPFEPRHDSGLSGLFDRLAGDEDLYAPLRAGDETFAGPLHENVGYVAPESLPPESVDEPDFALTHGPIEAEAIDVNEAEPVVAAEPDVIAAVIEFADDEEDIPSEADAAAEELVPDEPAATIWRITGRGFTPAAAEPPVPETIEQIAVAAEAITEGATPDTETVERVSRYNFDELSRILTDRVGSEAPAESEIAADAQRRPAAESSLVNLAAETFVLNRLPIGIMVFRDQQVLFANRALTDLTGYEAVEGLRSAGLAAIFPGEDSTAAGPVTHLVRRDGSRMPVRARLQSITWQGRPALMLSALTGEEPRGHEGAVRAFAEIAAEAREEGYVRTDRSGTITQVSLHARVILGKTEADLVGQPVSTFIDTSEVPALREFLERPARFAETARPSFVAQVAGTKAEITLFAEGQAGVIAGYFGFLRTKPTETTVRDEPRASLPPPREDDVEPSMLSRLSRGIRRPLSTIIGFADLIRSSAFGTIENARYLEYARDIKTAGSEIATLVDELDDFTRLKEGRYAARPAELDLGALLESCMVRVRGQAGAARVLVRSAISERLPRIRADRASLGQAVLNLLASAIDQTPPGGSVILSAQVEDDASIAVNVRDSGERSADLGERFVVFRDGVGKDGEALAPVRSSVGLALTRSLLAVNTCSLSVDPSGGVGTLFSLVIPAELVADS